MSCERCGHPEKEHHDLEVLGARDECLALLRDDVAALRAAIHALVSDPYAAVICLDEAPVGHEDEVNAAWNTLVELDDR